MKNILLVTIASLLVFSSCTKNNDASPQAVTTVDVSAVPQVVVASLTKNFPTATQTSWVQTSQTAYMASFKVANVGKTATFSNTGLFSKTGTIIDASTLPTAITDYLTKKIGRASCRERV